MSGAYAGGGCGDGFCLTYNGVDPSTRLSTVRTTEYSPKLGKFICCIIAQIGTVAVGTPGGHVKLIIRFIAGMIGRPSESMKESPIFFCPSSVLSNLTLPAMAQFN